MGIEWTRTYKEAICKFIPTKTVTIKPNEAPWMNGKLQRQIAKRNKYYKKAKNTNNAAEWAKFKIQRNRVSAQIKEAKDKYNQKLEDKINTTCERKDKLWYKLVKQVLNKNKSSQKTCSSLLINDKVITKDDEKANALNDYFADQSKINTNGAEPLRAEPPEDATMENIKITALTVQSVLQNLKTNAASGPDNISPRFLKRNVNEISPSLARIFNFSLQTSNYPEIWKDANITPIHKKGETSNTKNYRPISLLSCVGKAFERCVHEQVLTFLIENNRLSKFQADYTPKSSTITQLIEIYHHIQTALDSSKEIRFTFCDCSKAFDRVWHKGAI